MGMRYCGIHLFLTFLPIFLGKACPDTRIGWLNPECYDPAYKNIDSTVQLTPMATWNDLFCRIRKSHTQSHMWNHTHMLMFFIFVRFA